MPTTIPAATVPVLTNPLSLYRSLVSTKRIDPDPAQHRLALHLQKLYTRLIDYSPKVDYGHRFRAISRVYEDPLSEDDSKQLAVPGHPIWKNPIFSHLFPKKVQRESLALTRVLTDYEEAMKLQSPQGLLVHGEVGSGKSMLVDLLADGLPNRNKKKWHFNAFMLEILAKLEQLRRSRSQKNHINETSEHSIVWLAKDMIDKSPILFLDEFQLPDRAASKIISQLLTAFFQLGGVLIATSNRMPDELSKSSGVDFTAPSISGFGTSLLGFGKRSHISMLPTNNEYAGFIEVLKARCEIWNMEGERDWRRKEAEEMLRGTSQSDKIVNEDRIDYTLNNNAGVNSVSGESKDSSSILPLKYFLNSSNNDRDWKFAIKTVLLSAETSPVSWKSEDIIVYARKVVVPRQLNGVSYWKFTELCGGPLGPADYITLASKYHTFIIDEVPIMTLAQKNEARRLITLLDALYEARCKLILRAEAGPDDLFFPELSITASSKSSAFMKENGTHSATDDSQEAVYSETIAEIYQDKTLPFRPNISSYSNGSGSEYYNSEIEPNFHSITEQRDGGRKINDGEQNKSQVDFTSTSSFTGEDERFAYKRARSRLWEMCGARWHSRSDTNWWRPLPVEVRTWESSTASAPNYPLQEQLAYSDVVMGQFVELDKPAGLQGQELKEKESSCKTSCQCKTEV